MKLSETQIEKAVEYWTKTLSKPHFETLSPEERNQSGSQPAAMAEIMASNAHEAPEEWRITNFKTALRTRLKSDVSSFCLNVDYHASKFLSEAAEEAEIQVNILTFPWKTNMVFRKDGKVEVSEGYRAAYIEL